MTTYVTAAHPAPVMKATPAKRPTIGATASRLDDLAAAIDAWNRIAAPAADPGPCPVPWCIGCMWSGDAEDARLHQSAAATIAAYEFNGQPGATPEHVIRVTVERCDGGRGDEPAIVHAYLGRREGPDLGPGKARELAAALRKAQGSARDLQRDDVKDGTGGAVSVVRVRDYTMQVGAVFDDGAANVFINYVRAYTAVEQRDQVRHGLTCLAQPTESWDLLPVEAGQLADAVEAAAQLVDADRRTATAPTCPPWCRKHATDPDGSICHEGQPLTIRAAGGGNLVSGEVTLNLNRFDEYGITGQTAVVITASPDGIDLTAAELRQVAAAAHNLADQAETGRAA